MRTILFAKGFTGEQRAACKSDYDKYCKGTMPGGGRVLACLNKQYARLTEACKKVVELAEKVMPWLRIQILPRATGVGWLSDSSAVSLPRRR
jgi:Cysteine rich repeat